MILISILIIITILVIKFPFHNKDIFIDFVINFISILPLPIFIKKGALFFINYFLYKKPIQLKQKRNVLTPLIKKKIASNQKWKCKICHQLLDYTYEIDHIQPIFKGGTNNINNLQALCRNCHGKKTLDDY
jgi:purine-cytosine permease-like protein